MATGGRETRLSRAEYESPARLNACSLCIYAYLRCVYLRSAELRNEVAESPLGLLFRPFSDEATAASAAAGRDRSNALILPPRESDKEPCLFPRIAPNGRTNQHTIAYKNAFFFFLLSHLFRRVAVCGIASG